MSELLNSIWPNGIKKDADGYSVYYPLGTNKIDIPDGSKWPKGTKLKFPFVYDENGQLTGFCDTKSMIANSGTNIYLPYEEIEADFSSINKGTLGIHAPNATVKKAIWQDSEEEDIPEAQFKYKGCTTLDDVKTVDANYQTTDIVDGVWSEPLWDLTNGKNMFSDCESLSSFTSDLPSLTNGYRMFEYCDVLTSWNIDLPSLTDGSYMFENCYNLPSFSSDLSSLTNSQGMFKYCESLTSFTSNLSSLTMGNDMFSYCKLDAPSIKNIIDTINANTKIGSLTGKLKLGMGCNNTTEDKDLFAQEVGYADMTSLLAALQAKDWTVTAQYNGRLTTTYGLRRPSEDTLPIFVQLEETEDHANYTSLDDSKKYRLNWFHETTGSTEGYTQFNSLEEAIETFNIKPIERN